MADPLKNALALRADLLNELQEASTYVQQAAVKEQLASAEVTAAATRLHDAQARVQSFAAFHFDLLSAEELAAAHARVAAMPGQATTKDALGGYGSLGLF